MLGVYKKIAFDLEFPFLPIADNPASATITQDRKYGGMQMELLPKNEGFLDRGLRVVAGLALIASYFAGILPVWGLIGILPVVTGLLGSCPAYTLLGLSTCPMKNNK